MNSAQGSLYGEPRVIARIEDAIKQRIIDAGLPYLRTVATYGGEFDDELSGTVRLFPAVWIAFAGSDRAITKNTARTLFKVNCRFAIMVGAYNPRNEEATRKGSVGKGKIVVGTYQMMEDIEALLSGYDPGDNMDLLMPGRVRTLFASRLNKKGISIIAQDWHSAYLTGAPGDNSLPTSELPLLQRVNIGYHLPAQNTEPMAQDVVVLNKGRKK